MVAKLILQSELKKIHHEKMLRKQQHQREKKIQEQRESSNKKYYNNNNTRRNSIGTQSTCSTEDVPPIRVITFIRKEA